MSSRKAAIELSMNFFVILIISLVVFGSGMTLFWKIYQHGEEELGRVSRNVEQMIIKQLHGGDKVSVVPRSIDLERDDQYIVGVGIKNVLTVEKVFKVFVEKGLFVRDEFTCSFYSLDIFDGAEDCVNDYNVPELKILGGEAQVRVEANKQEISNIMIKADRKAMSGEYVINICVCYEDCYDYESCLVDSYDKNYRVSKIRVTVK